MIDTTNHNQNTSTFIQDFKAIKLALSKEQTNYCLITFNGGRLLSMVEDFKEMCMASASIANLVKG